MFEQGFQEAEHQGFLPAGFKRRYGQLDLSQFSASEPISKRQNPDKTPISCQMQDHLAMEPAPDYSEEQVADELAVVMWTGVGRPLPTRKTEADIPALAAIARELATDPTLPLTRLIAEVVRQAIRRMFPENRKEAAACLLDIDVDPHKSLDELEIAPGRKPLDKHRRPDVAKHLNETWESYRRNSAVLERRLLEEVAGQLLGLVATHRRGQAPSDESNTGPAAAKPTRTDDGSEPEPTTSVEANDRRRVLVAIIGGGLTLVGVAWLAATMTGALS